MRVALALEKDSKGRRSVANFLRGMLFTLGIEEVPFWMDPDFTITNNLRMAEHILRDWGNVLFITGRHSLTSRITDIHERYAPVNRFRVISLAPEENCKNHKGHCGHKEALLQFLKEGR